LDPDDIRSLSVGAMWDFPEGPGRPWLGIRLWGTKALF